MASLNEVILEAARLSGAAYDSTCTSAGTTTTLIDLAAIDQGTDASFAKGGWIYRTEATSDDDKVRRISSFDPATGTYTVGRAWTDAPDDEEAYQVYALFPPIEQPGIPQSWRRFANRAFDAIWFEDQMVIGSGDGSAELRFPLVDDTGFTPNEEHVKGVLLREVDSNGLTFDVDMNKRGRSWRIEYAYGLTTIVLSQAPTEAQSVVVVCNRSYPTLTDDTDENTCPLNLAARRTAYEMYRYLDSTPASRGQYQGEALIAYTDFQAEYRQHKPRGAVILQ